MSDPVGHAESVYRYNSYARITYWKALIPCPQSPRLFNESFCRVIVFFSYFSDQLWPLILLITCIILWWINGHVNYLQCHMWSSVFLNENLLLFIGMYPGSVGSIQAIYVTVLWFLHITSALIQMLKSLLSPIMRVNRRKLIFNLWSIINYFLFNFYGFLFRKHL